MGGVVSFVKKVWSGIKNIAKKVWNGVKTVVKAVVNVVKNVAVIIVNGVKKLVQVVASLVFEAIKTLLISFVLVLASPLILLLTIIFLSSAIIFGRNSNQNQNNGEREGDKEQYQYNLGKNDKPNFENDPKKKEINLQSVFLENTQNFIKEYIDDFIKQFTYSFTLKGDSVSVKEIKKKEEEEEDDDSDLKEKPQQNNVLISSISYKFNNVSKNVNLSFDNKIPDKNIGRKILKQIKEQLDELYPKKVSVIEDGKSTEIEAVRDIETLLIVISL